MPDQRSPAERAREIALEVDALFHEGDNSKRFVEQIEAFVGEIFECECREGEARSACSTAEQAVAEEVRAIKAEKAKPRLTDHAQPPDKTRRWEWRTFDYGFGEEELSGWIPSEVLEQWERDRRPDLWPWLNPSIAAMFTTLSALHDEYLVYHPKILGSRGLKHVSEIANMGECVLEEHFERVRMWCREALENAPERLDACQTYLTCVKRVLRSPSPSAPKYPEEGDAAGQRSGLADEELLRLIASKNREAKEHLDRVNAEWIKKVKGETVTEAEREGVEESNRLLAGAKKATASHLHTLARVYCHIAEVAAKACPRGGDAELNGCYIKVVRVIQAFLAQPDLSDFPEGFDPVVESILPVSGIEAGWTDEIAPEVYDFLARAQAYSVDWPLGPTEDIGPLAIPPAVVDSFCKRATAAADEYRKRNKGTAAETPDGRKDDATPPSHLLRRNRAKLLLKAIDRLLELVHQRHGCSLGEEEVRRMHMLGSRMNRLAVALDLTTPDCPVYYYRAEPLYVVCGPLTNPTWPGGFTERGDKSGFLVQPSVEWLKRIHALRDKAKAIAGPGERNGPPMASTADGREASGNGLPPKKEASTGHEWDEFYLLAKSSVFYALPCKEVAEKIVELFQHKQSPEQPVIEVVNAADLDLTQRVLRREEIGVLEKIEEVGDWDPGIWAEAGLPSDGWTQTLVRLRWQARQWEPLVRDELAVVHGKAKGFYLWWTWWDVSPPAVPTANLKERTYFYRADTEDAAARLCRAFGQVHGIEIRFGYTASEALDIDAIILANASIEKYRRGEYTGEDAHLFADARQWEYSLPADPRFKPLPHKAADDERCAATHGGPNGSGSPGPRGNQNNNGAKVDEASATKATDNPSSEQTPGETSSQGLLSNSDAVVQDQQSLEMSPEEQRNSALLALMLFAQAYYKFLECATSVPCGALDIELNQSYLWIVSSLTNLLKNKELSDFPAKFEPVFSDLYPSTCKDVDWEDMVAFGAEGFLGTVQQYVYAKGAHDPEKGSPTWVFVEMLRSQVVSAIDKAIAYNTRMREVFQKVLGLADQGGKDRSTTDGGTDEERETAIRALLNPLVLIDTQLSNLHVRMKLLREENPHGAFSDTPPTKMTFAQQQEFQNRILAWTNPIRDAIEEAKAKCAGIAMHVTGVIDNPAMWETDLRANLRLLGEGIWSFHQCGSTSTFEQEGQLIQDLGCQIYCQGTRLEDAYQTVEAASSKGRPRPLELLPLAALAKARSVPAGNTVKTTTETQAPEKTNGAGTARQVAPDERLSPAAIAKALGLLWPHEALRKRLERFRKTNKDGFWEMANRKPTEPQFLYRAGTVLPLLQDLKASGKTSSKRPARKKSR